MQNYGGLSEEYTQYNSSDIIIIPVPYDGTSTWGKGADRGPAALLEASANMELYDIETDSEVYLKGIHTTGEITTEKSPEFLAPLVKEKVLSVFRDHKLPVVIGGEHSVSIGAFQAAAEFFDDLTILQIDAHADLRDTYEGSAYNHACVMARARELAPIVQVGIRSMSVEEKENMDYNRVIFAREMSRDDKWEEKALSASDRKMSISLSIWTPSIPPTFCQQALLNPADLITIRFLIS